MTIEYRECDTCEGVGKVPGDEPGQESCCSECGGEGKIEVAPPKFYSVGICLHDRSCGGPEEGGWWYDTYDPVDSYGHLTQCFKDKDSAYAYKTHLEQKIATMGINKGRRSVNSVLSEGEFVVIVFIDSYPHYLPDRRPHYE